MLALTTGQPPPARWTVTSQHVRYAPRSTAAWCLVYAACQLGLRASLTLEVRWRAVVGHECSRLGCPRFPRFGLGPSRASLKQIYGQTKKKLTSICVLLSYVSVCVCQRPKAVCVVHVLRMCAVPCCAPTLNAGRGNCAARGVSTFCRCSRFSLSSSSFTKSTCSSTAAQQVR